MTRDELKALAAKDTRGIVYDRKYYDRAVKEMGGQRLGEHVGHESNPIQKQRWAGSGHPHPEIEGLGGEAERQPVRYPPTGGI